MWARGGSWGGKGRRGRGGRDRDLSGECEWDVIGDGQCVSASAGAAGAGWVEGEAVICPWHSWAFNTKTGLAEYPEHERVDVFPLRVEGDDVLVDIE